MLHSPFATTKTEGHQRNVIKTPSRRSSVPATLTTTSGRHLMLTLRPGTGFSIRSSAPLKTLAGQLQGETHLEENSGNLSSHTRLDL